MMTEENYQAPDIHEEIGDLTRGKIVRQLHDGLTQTVSALAMRINYARRLMTIDPEAAGAELEKVEDLTREAAKEIRHIIFLLRPEGQGDSGLITELESLSERMGELFGLEIDMDCDEVLVNELSDDVKDVIYGIAEELIDSARKLDEKKLLLGLSLTKSDLVQLKLEDQVESNHKANSFQGMDLNIIQSYANLIDGSVIVDKDGHQVQVLFPLRTNAGAGDALV